MLTTFDIAIGVFTIIGGTLAVVGAVFAVCYCFGWRYIRGEPPPQVVQLTSPDREAIEELRGRWEDINSELRDLNSKFRPR